MLWLKETIKIRPSTRAEQWHMQYATQSTDLREKSYI